MTVKVKICGLSEPRTLDAALNAGADFVGLVFFPKSPRNVALEKARDLATLARGKAKIMALTVDADDALLEQIATRVRPNYIQAQGTETPERLKEIKVVTGIPVIKAINVTSKEDVANAEAYRGIADLLMFDSKPTATLPGGTGQSFDWDLLAEARHPFILAGGLDAGNVAKAIRKTSAKIVDVSSGVESAPGVKDEDLIVKFIEAAKAAG